MQHKVVCIKNCHTEETSKKYGHKIIPDGFIALIPVIFHKLHAGLSSPAIS